MAEFGNDLRRERESRGVALEDIAQGTKVSVRHLRALEEEAFRDLPGGVFNKGILKAYVRFLDLDEPVWVERFERCPGVGNTEADWSTFAENVRRNRMQASRRNRLRWIGVITLLLLLAAGGWLVWHYILQPRYAGEGGATSRQTLPQRGPTIG